MRHLYRFKSRIPSGAVIVMLDSIQETITLSAKYFSHVSHSSFFYCCDSEFSCFSNGVQRVPSATDVLSAALMLKIIVAKRSR